MNLPRFIPYNRDAAVAYAHQWAYRRNPAYYDYEKLGGDCTNFASQCLYAGSGVMNFTPTYGWYYRDANNKSPAWTGVEYFHNFMVRNQVNPGPFGEVSDMNRVDLGDFVQLRFSGRETYSHTPIIVSIGEPRNLSTILVAAHSYDADYRPLNSYQIEAMRFIHILGVYPPNVQTFFPRTQNPAPMP